VRGDPILPSHIGGRLIKLGSSDAKNSVNGCKLGNEANQDSWATLEPGSKPVKRKEKYVVHNSRSMRLLTGRRERDPCDNCISRELGSYLD
jgi:hypothetical protein